jgi:hypothetical protein
MKTKLLLVLAAALALCTAMPALAAKRPARAAKKPAAPVGFQRELRKLGITCPRASVHLAGSFGGAGDGFVAVTVSRGTGKARSLAGKQVSLRLLASTHILRNGPSTAARLKAGDRLNVVALMCSQGLVARTINATGKHS